MVFIRRFTRTLRYELLVSYLSASGLLIASILVINSSENDQSSLTAILVTCSIIFTMAWCIPAARSKADGRIDWLHPAILVVVVYYAYFMFPGIWLWLAHDCEPLWINSVPSQKYLINIAFFLGALSMAGFGLGCRSRVRFPGTVLRKALYQTEVLRFKEIRYLILLFFIIGLIVKLYHMSLFDTFSFDLLQYLSPSARRGLNIGTSQFVLLLGSMLNWALLLTIFYLILCSLRRRVTWSEWMLVALFTVFVMTLDYIIFSKRSGIILLVILPFIWYSYLVRRLNFSRAIMWASVGFGLIGLLLIARIALPLVHRDLIPSEYIGGDVFEIIKFYFDQPEWASFEMFLVSITQRAELLDEAGGVIIGFLKYTFMTVIIFIPRAIWPSKPDYEDLSHVYYRTVFQVDEGVGIAPTIWGASYLFFHVIGLVIGMYILGWLLKGFYDTFRPNQGRPYDVFFYGIFFWMAFQFLRFGTTGFLLIYFIQVIAMGVVAGLFLARKVRR